LRDSSKQGGNLLKQKDAQILSKGVPSEALYLLRTRIMFIIFTAFINSFFSFIIHMRFNALINKLRQNTLEWDLNKKVIEKKTFSYNKMRYIL